jgi:hypothetical protein
MMASLNNPQPIYGAGPAIARVGQGVLAGLMSGMAERDDRAREEAQQQQIIDRQDKREYLNQQGLAEFLGGGAAMPQQAPQMAPQAAPQSAAMPMPAGDDTGVAASTARYNAVPGRPPVGASYREPEWAAGLPPANGRINPLPLEGGTAPAATQPRGQPDAFTMAQRALASSNPLIRQMAPLYTAQAARDDTRNNRPQVMVSPGSTVLDPQTMRPVFTAPRAPEAPSELDRLMQGAGLQPGSPEAQAAMRAILDRRGQAPQTNINTGDSPQAILARSDVDTIKSQNAVANQARILLPLFDRAEEAIRAVPEGAGAQFAPILGQVAAAFGANVQGTSEAEVLRALTATLAPLQRVEGSGATSDRDIGLYISAVPRLGNTREGNLALVDMGRRASQRRIEEATIWRQFAGTPDVMERLNSLPPLWSEEERAMLRGRSGARGTQQPAPNGPSGMTIDPPPASQGGGWSIRPVR